MDNIYKDNKDVNIICKLHSIVPKAPAPRNITSIM